MNNKLIIAAAGSGKTEFIVKEALKQRTGKVLITTFTQANEKEIRNRFIKLNKCIPQNVTIQTWFSFLLQHGVRPYQGCLYEKEIKGMILVNGQSPSGIPETAIDRYYLSPAQKIYSDKLAKFVVRCNEKTNGLVINRLARIFSYIFVDEVQDLAGYDLDILKLLFKSDINTLLVGDPRQATYSTNNSVKNRKYKKTNIVNFFADNTMSIDTDTTSLTVNYRSGQNICNLSNKLFPNLPQVTSGSKSRTEHDGIYLVKSKDIKTYLENFTPMQLRWDSKVKINEDYKVMTFGDSKGQAFDRVLVYPTAPFTNWLKDNNFELSPTSRSKLYVGLTRGRFSVAIVCNDKLDEPFDDFTFFKPPEDKLI